MKSLFPCGAEGNYVTEKSAFKVAVGNNELAS